MSVAERFFGGERVGVAEKIAALHRGRVEKIAGLSEDHGLVVVGGSLGSGKTEFLIPQISAVLQNRGYEVRGVEGQESGGGTVSTQRGRFIVDDAEVVSQRGQDYTTKILRALRQRGWGVIAIVSYARDEEGGIGRQVMQRCGQPGSG